MNLILFEPGETPGTLPGTDGRARHLTKVLRKQPGDRFDAGILGGGVGRALVERVGEDGSVTFSLAVTAPPPARLPVRVAVGFPRPIQLRRILRDLTGMGVERIDLVGSDLGEKSYRDTKLLCDGGARAAMIEGASQSRDAALPGLAVFRRLDAWLDSLPAGDGGVLLAAADNVNADGSFFTVAPGFNGAVLAVGPERGWSDRERALFAAAGFARLSLGARALRTETACVAATALVLEKIGAPG